MQKLARQIGPKKKKKERFFFCFGILTQTFQKLCKQNKKSVFDFRKKKRHQQDSNLRGKIPKDF